MKRYIKRYILPALFIFAQTVIRTFLRENPAFLRWSLAQRVVANQIK